MGIITNLSFKSLDNLLQHYCKAELYEAKESKNGISDTVYILDTSVGGLVFKLYEQSDIAAVQREVELLKALSTLKVSIPILDDPFLFYGKPAMIYKQTTGEHLQNVSKKAMYDIGEFCSSMHAITAEKTSKNQTFNDMFRSFLPIVADTPFAPFEPLLKKMSEMRDDGIIHGDLFLDNLFFEGEKLSGVIDFIEAANGSFLFELGVVVFSFCANETSIDNELATALLDGYGNKKIDIRTLTEYAVYAALFYGINRYLKNKNWEGCAKFLESGKSFYQPLFF